MNDVLIQHQAEVKVLEYKLNRIREKLELRMKIVDPIVKNELQAILSMIEEYEIVPAGWSLKKQFVSIPEKEDKIDV